MKPITIVFICPHGLGNSAILADVFSNYMKLHNLEGKFVLKQAMIPGNEIGAKLTEGLAARWRLEEGLEEHGRHERGQKEDAVFITLPNYKRRVERLVKEKLIPPSRLFFVEFPNPLFAKTKDMAQDPVYCRNITLWMEQIIGKLKAKRILPHDKRVVPRGARRAFSTPTYRAKLAKCAAKKRF
jgi:hypothetical protein